MFTLIIDPQSIMNRVTLYLVFFRLFALMRKLLLIVIICVCGTLNAQNRFKSILLTNDSITLDSNSIQKNSIKISTAQTSYVEGIDFRINYYYRALINLKIPKGTVVDVKYGASNFNLSQVYLQKSTNIIDVEGKETKNPFLYIPNENEFSAISGQDKGLKINGSIMRGLGLGNAQNVVVNSNLNLQLSGKINNEIDVLAAISDDNNPIQPEGNTQQLQDFDKVFIQLSKDKTKVVIGDFEMRKPSESYFLNYNKKSRGAQAQTAFALGNKGNLQVGAELAISRGRFARNTITAIEGNQGPYRLQGANGELFIILISGTEAIYLDGEKLNRGEQNDYIIDYNSGELTFTPKRIITQYSRIVAEFQYSDRNFARTIFTSQAQYSTKDYAIHAAYYTEQDDKDQPFQQNLTDSDKKILAGVGNNLNQAVVSGATRVATFTNTKILYRLIDTLGSTGVYVYTNTDANDSIFYEVKYSNVGNNNGNYIQSASSANGRVFQFVAPINGVKQGNFEPVILLTAPNQMQMMTAGVEFSKIKNTQINVEIAQSDYNRNLFSSADKQNDKGYGVKVDVKNNIEWSKKWEVNNQIKYEWVDNNFRYVERYRNVEFDRIWNRQLNNTSTKDTGYNEHIVSGRTSLQYNKTSNVYYQIAMYNRNTSYVGLQHTTGALINTLTNQFKLDAEFLSIHINDKNLLLNVPQNQTNKYAAGYIRTQFKHQLGINYTNEQSKFYKTGDSLLSGSFAYNQSNAFFQNTDTTRIKYRLDYTNRNDLQANNTSFKLYSIAQNVNSSLVLNQTNGNKLNLNFTFRNFELVDSAFTNVKPERTILARIEYDYSFAKRFFTANTYYQIGSGNELRRDFSYIEVPKGQGIYVWQDFNKDDVQQLNEFVIASFADKNIANFIRVFLPTNSSIKTNSVQFNQTLNINPASVWFNQKGIKHFFALFYNQSGLRIERKIVADNTFNFANPFANQFNDTALINVNSVARNTLFFNRSNTTFGADWSIQDNQSKIFLTNGIDSRRKLENGINTRWNLNEIWTINLLYNFGVRSYISQFFTQQNYEYNYYEWKPKLIYQATKNFRTTLNASYSEAQNSQTYGSQKGKTTEVGIEMRYNFTQIGVLSARYSLYEVSFNGEAASNLGYDMLQGLTTGRNQLWNVNLQQRIGQNIQLNINYDGRVSGLSDTILHVGRMEARYIF